MEMYTALYLTLGHVSLHSTVTINLKIKAKKKKANIRKKKKRRNVQCHGVKYMPLDMIDSITQLLYTFL